MTLNGDVLNLPAPSIFLQQALGCFDQIFTGEWELTKHCPSAKRRKGCREGPCPNINSTMHPGTVEQVKGKNWGQACLIWTAPAYFAVQAMNDLKKKRYPSVFLIVDIVNNLMLHVCLGLSYCEIFYYHTNLLALHISCLFSYCHVSHIIVNKYIHPNKNLNETYPTGTSLKHDRNYISNL